MQAPNATLGGRLRAVSCCGESICKVPSTAQHSTARDRPARASARTGLYPSIQRRGAASDLACPPVAIGTRRPRALSQGDCLLLSKPYCLACGQIVRQRASLQHASATAVGSCCQQIWPLEVPRGYLQRQPTRLRPTLTGRGRRSNVHRQPFAKQETMDSVQTCPPTARAWASQPGPLPIPTHSQDDAPLVPWPAQVTSAVLSQPFFLIPHRPSDPPPLHLAAPPDRPRMSWYFPVDLPLPTARP